MDAAAETSGDSKRTAADTFLRSVLGTVFAVAVAALALWPHVRPLIE